MNSQSAELHLLTDHGAWLVYGLAPLYALLPSLQWLLALQAASVAFTAVPLWILAREAGLPPRLRWTVCGLWWLQPVVFNTNLFDFHPEVLHAAAGGSGDRWSAPVDRGLGRIDPADPRLP